MSKEVEIYVNIFSLLFSIKCVIMCSLVHFKFIKKRRKWGKLLELTILFYISASMPISLVIPNIWPYTWSSIYKSCITWINYLIVPVLFYYSMCVYLTSIKSRSGVSHMVSVTVGTVRGWFLLVWPCGFGLGDSWLDLRDVILASEVGTFWRRSRKTLHWSDRERGWVINYWESSGKLGAAWCLVSSLGVW